MKPGNLFADAAAPDTGERFDELLARGHLVVERIVSSACPDQTEYCQAHDEWVVLLRGEATLHVEGGAVELRAGDYLFLPSGTPHVVRRTTAGAMWLAVHHHDAEPPSVSGRRLR